MLNIFFKIDSNLLPLLVDQIHYVCSEFEDALAIDVKFPDNDPELLQSWKQSLLADLQYDCQSLLSLMTNETFGQQSVTLDLPFAEAISRACSAIRLKLRSDFLSRISNKDLESDNLDLTKIPNELIQPYTCFIFLASLQEAIVEGMEMESDVYN